MTSKLYPRRRDGHLGHGGSVLAGASPIWPAVWRRSTRSPRNHKKDRENTGARVSSGGGRPAGFRIFGEVPVICRHPPTACETELGGSSGSGSRLFRILSKVPLPSGCFFVRKTCLIRRHRGQINIRPKFLSLSTIFLFALSPHQNLLSNNVRQGHRYRFGHHLLVSRLPLISRVPPCAHHPTVALVSGKMIALRSSPTTRVTGQPHLMFLSQTPNVSLATLQRTRSR